MPNKQVASQSSDKRVELAHKFLKCLQFSVLESGKEKSGWTKKKENKESKDIT